MLFERKWFDRAACTREEKIPLAALIGELVRCCGYAKKNGILSLPSLEVSDELLRIGLDSIESGLQSPMLEEKLMTKALAELRTGTALLRAMIIIDGVFMIYERKDIEELRDKLRCYLGADEDLAEAAAPGDE